MKKWRLASSIARRLRARSSRWIFPELWIRAGLHQRMLSTAFTGIGGQYQYSEPKMSPDGAWMFVPCWWVNGVRSEVCGVYLPPLPVADSVVRTSLRSAGHGHFRHFRGSSAGVLGLCGKRSGGWFAEQFVSDLAAGAWLFARVRARTAPAMRPASSRPTPQPRGVGRRSMDRMATTLSAIPFRYPCIREREYRRSDIYKCLERADTSDVRALQRVTASGNIAACLLQPHLVYSGSQFYGRRAASSRVLLPGLGTGQPKRNDTDSGRQ